MSAAKKEKTVPVQTKETQNPLIVKEAVLWLILAVCILMFISYFGFGGYVGEVVADISFGVFGFPAYLFPILIFIASAFLISNRGSRIAGVKFAASLFFYVCICSFTALFTKQYELASQAAELYERSAAYKTGGGVIGGMICSVLAPALGALGTGVVLLIFSIISVVLITQRSLIGSVKHQGRKMYQSARESSERRREAHLQELKQREDWKLLEDASEQEDKNENAGGFCRLPVRDRRKAEYGRGVQQGYGGRPQRGYDGRMQQDMAAGQRQMPGDRAQQEQLLREQRQKEQGEINIPIAFPVHQREHRLDRRVSGVTMDTKIQGSPEHVGAEIHEIRPKAASVTGPEESCYIDLEHLEQTDSDTGRPCDQRQLQREKTSDAPEPVPAHMELHIEGIDRTSAEQQEARMADGYGDGIMEDEPNASVLNAEARDTDNPEWDEEEYNADDAAWERDLCENSELSSESGTVKKNSVGASDDFGIFRTASNGAAPSSAGTVFRDTDSHSVPSKRNPRSSEKEIADGIASVEAEIEKAAEAVKREYVFPPIDLLKKGKNKSNSGQEQEIRKTAAKLQQTLNSFGVHVTVTNVSCGPSVTRYELQPEQGVKVSRIVALADDIKLNLAAADIRIEAPIPGKAAVGIEVPNAENSAVALRDLIESEEFKNHPSRLAFATGKDIGGKVVVSDIAKMPHLLVAGATGSGKSVCMNTIIMSILYKANPDEVKLIMIDPKVVELSVYNGIPHLFIPVVTDPKKAAGALNWAVAEMTDRYNKFAEYGVRDLKGYNRKIESLDNVEDENKPKKLPQIVIIVDELADLMMVAPGEVEDSICRLAQLARACGIHLIIATQRPSVNVITGLIKANMPSRIAFSVSSGVDSRTIIDMNGAEKLLGKGDMLFYPQGYQKPARVQGAFVSDEEVADVVDFLKNKNAAASYSAEMEEQIAKVQLAVSATRGAEDTDALFADAGKFIIDKDKASIGMLQRVFKIGFNRAARIMDQLSDAGVVGPEEGTKPRKILMSPEEFENYLEENG